MNNQERIKKLVDGFGTWYEDEKLLESGKMSSALHPYTSMFSPIQINRLKIKNRLVMAPMGNISMAEETGRPSTKMVQYFARRAEGGVGLITSGLVPISHGIDNTVTEMGDRSYFPRIDKSRSVFSGWRDIAEKCHAHDTSFFIQLTPGLGRVGSPECLVNKMKFPISASWNPNFYIPAIPCKPISGRAAWKIIKNAGQASADAKSLTIDGVYLHGHEGYFLEQMTNPAFNRRKIGKFADWKAFGVEMVKEIRKRTGKSYPIMYRIDLSLVLNETYTTKMNDVKSLKKFRNERSVDMTLDYMKDLVAAGVDVFDVDLGCYDNWWLPHPPGPMPPGCFLEVSQIVKEYFAENKIISNAGVEVPVVGVGKLGYPDVAEAALRDGQCDMVMLGRPLLADPDWPKKVYAGRVDEIAPCIGDQEGCINEFVEGGHPQCAINPITGFEDIFNGTEMTRVDKPRKVAVMGAGPSGVMTALTAARRGHDVTLFEKRDEIGGMLNPGSRPSIKFDIINYLNYLKKQIELCSKEHNLSLKLNTAPTPDQLKAEGWDVIVASTGTAQKRPPVKGIEASNVIFAVDLLRDPSLAEKAENIVVVGGGVVGCETAYFLRHEKGKNVQLVEMLPQIMEGVCTANRGYLIHYLEELGVPLHNCTMLKEVKGRSAVIMKNQSKTVPDPYVTWSPILPENIENPFAKAIKDKPEEIEIDADLIVLAAGAVPDDSFFYECQEKNSAPEIHNIGDSSRCGRVFEAVKAAYQIGTSI
ncbi:MULTISPECIES: FAD-dependent oxidoreductase [unclassified Oceanispirochaeta]|uniref:FAD-dependent oxidoreductase n=1 Tax=unclassified Oceanispirochaeta TaxID=2635722 RepID=UPI00149509BE|nr:MULTISPECIES: FAD-dependent oxidoreductase [unclassified Oceanispirochaeta]MBF9018159.1 FAD-dependent oxidoreductase [Oceanispirochaeta sp. M2]NPD74658.1 FAD-dependent oxidoreductase [Oceanispirochaeta sp. M1]